MLGIMLCLLAMHHRIGVLHHRRYLFIANLIIGIADGTAIGMALDIGDDHLDKILRHSFSGASMSRGRLWIRLWMVAYIL